jgi:ATP-dependent exoDNAse (exonuclease V) alpha subunit
MIFRKGDYVINVKNTYRVKDVNDVERDIMNGDTGKIVKVIDNEDEKCVFIKFDECIVKYSSSELDKLLHAWCLTMHKSQGSSAKAVIVIADKAHTFQLNANLFYTADTRPEHQLACLCQPQVVNSAMKKVESLRRNTLLQEFLQGKIAV